MVEEIQLFSGTSRKMEQKAWLAVDNVIEPWRSSPHPARTMCICLPIIAHEHTSQASTCVHQRDHLLCGLGVVVEKHFPFDAILFRQFNMRLPLALALMEPIIEIYDAANHK